MLLEVVIYHCFSHLSLNIIFRHLRLLQVWQRAILQYLEIPTLFAVARVHVNSEVGQRVQVRGVTFCPQGVVRQVRQRTRPRISQRRPEEWPVALLNILLLSLLQEGERGG